MPALLLSFLLCLYPSLLWAASWRRLAICMTIQTSFTTKPKKRTNYPFRGRTAF